jgi:hypothetical protein
MPRALLVDSLKKAKYGSFRKIRKEAHVLAYRWNHGDLTIKSC